MASNNYVKTISINDTEYDIKDEVGRGAIATLASTVVTDVGTSGNSLTWTQNGTTNNITVPYATLSDSANYLNPLQTKTYTGVLGTANNWANATFFFAKINPISYTDVWRIKYKIHAYTPNHTAYDQIAEVMISGSESAIRSYSSMNSLGNHCVYYHVLYRATEAGITNRYGHALGVRLYSSNYPTTSGYERTIEIELLETYNCTFTFFDECLKYANIPGTGATNYSAYSELNFISNGLQETGDANDANYQNRIYYTSSYAAETIYRYQLLLRTSDNKLLPVSSANNDITSTNKTYSSSEFNPFGEIYYYSSTTTKNANATLGNAVLYRQILVDCRYAFDITATGNYKFTARQPVYLTATLQSNGNAILTKPSGSVIGPLSQSLPSSEDGLIYIYLGQAYEDSTPYRLELSLNHPVYTYKNGRVRQIFPDALTVNGHTVNADVPADAVFTDTVVTKTSELTNDSGFITSYTETDPVFTASAAHGITSSDITNWNSKTSNVGTITGITMNGASKGTSGVVNLGTVLTEHQDISGKADVSALAAYTPTSGFATINGSSITGGGNVSIVAAEGQTITIDATPTDGSNNAVSSNGVYDALDAGFYYIEG